MKTFAGVHSKYSEFERAKILLQPIPYDGTSTWGKGADLGFESFLEASENMELYDLETSSEVYRNGIHVLPVLNGFESPEEMFVKVYNHAKTLLQSEKFLTFFGGEHSISIGIIKAFYQYFSNLTILQMDAHADLRPEYNGSPFNHACALHDASQNANLIQVGVRSADISEMPYMNKDKCFFSEKIYRNDHWMNQAIDKMTDKVYITFDLDAFDPSIMPSTGTPEPGGMDWNKTIQFLRKVFSQREVVGFDIVELAPIKGLNAPNFLAAKLYYKMLTYKFCLS